MYRPALPLSAAVFLALLQSPQLSAQCRQWSFPGGAAQDAFGAAVAALGDVDGDGVGDIAVGATQGLAGAAGYVQVLSGADGFLLHEFSGTVPWDQFGTAVAGPGDVDGDGHADILVGAPGVDTTALGAGQVLLFSGRDGSLLLQLDGDQSGGALGRALAGPGDLDGDGVPDFASGEPGNNENGGMNGAVHVYSGRTGLRVFSFFGEGRDNLGISVAAAGDVDADGCPDLIAGAAREDGATTVNVGGAWVLSGATGSAIHHWQGWTQDDSFGISVAGVGDWDGDGHDDVAVGAPAAFEMGVVVVISGRTGQNLAWLRGDGLLDGFGITLSGGQDADGDGVPDLLIGTPGASTGSFRSGAAVVHGGPWGALLLRLTGEHDLEGFGSAVALAGDLDGDGRSEVLVGAPRDDLAAPGAGSATLAFCGALVLDPPAPGLAGMDNLMVARSATSGAKIHFLWSVQLGGTVLPGCGAVVDLASPALAGASMADGDGIARLTVSVPAIAAGHLLALQAVEDATCRVSAPVLHRFP